MYFPLGWPKAINLSFSSEYTAINHVCCDAVKILIAVISNDVLSIWYSNPLIPISLHQRTSESLSSHGDNKFIVWKPDSREIAVLTEKGIIILYKIEFVPNGASILQQVDPPTENLKRESSELFVKENIPRLSLHEDCFYKLNAPITVISCISLTELLIATENCELVRLLWSDLRPLDNDNNQQKVPMSNVINLRHITFYVSQSTSLKTLPTIGENAYIASLEYSPFIGGCAAVFSDHRAVVLFASQLRFEEQSMHGFWVPDVDNAVFCSVNHKFRLMAYGRRDSDIIVYAIEDTTGNLEFSHRLSLDSCMIAQSLGPVTDLRWSPDGCVLAVTWDLGGIALWSTFGTLLMTSFNWDYGLHVDLILSKNPLPISRLEWSTEGYQLYLTCKADKMQTTSNVLQLSFVKSALATNPCMASQPRILLQGDDALYLNQGENLEKIYSGLQVSFPNAGTGRRNIDNDSATGINEVGMEIEQNAGTSNVLSESKHWITLQLPLTYSATNWPIRYSAIDSEGLHLAVAGRTGIAHYSVLNRKWKVFGNETQEKDFVVSGGLMYWKDFIILGCYSLLDQTDEIRCYPEEKKLDNQFGNKIQVRAPVISLNKFRDQLIALTADGIVSLFLLTKITSYSMNMECAYEIDVKNICIHPACIVSLTVTNLRNDPISKNRGTTNINENTSEAIIVNVSGRILMIQRDPRNNIISSLMASCLASCVECFWTSTDILKSPMHESLWLYSGANGMRVWLPILPPTNEQVYNAAQHLHTFMSKRIMLSFSLKLYPLVILFDNVIALGVENETTLYCNESQSHFALPFCVLEQKSQVYLHKILRQLIKRNLGYSAWEIAKSCRSLPYLPHSLELLLHEVLEEEATSKEPIPDALLPSILNFIREFPLYLQTVVQCARKTEIALWPYLFSVAGKPKDLFQQCLQSGQLDTAASFLVILQNLEPSFISKQYATLLLDIAIKNSKWELAKDLIRFLKAIDPNEIDSPRSSMIVNVKIAPPAQAKSQVNQNAEAFNMILGPIARERSFSTTMISHVPKERKDKHTTTVTANSNVTTASGSANELSSNTGVASIMRRKQERSNSTKDRKEIFCIETILQLHARTLLQNYKLFQLGYMSAYLDFHLVSWLSQETDGAAKLDDYIIALKSLHKEFNLSASISPCYDSDEVISSIDSSHFEQHPNFAFEDFPHRFQTQSLTSESGYFSHAKLDTPISTNTQATAIDPRIEGSMQRESPTECLLCQSNVCNQCQKLPNSPNSTQLDHDSLSPERIPYLYEKERACSLAFEDDNLSGNVKNSIFISNILPEKLSIKLRYLLQLFIEAKCIDYALVLSILLKDAASVGRIINGVIRAESITICYRIDSALRRLLQWSLEGEPLYRSFMISLRPHMNLLDQHLTTSQNNLNGNKMLNRRLTLASVGDDEEEVSDGQSKLYAYLSQKNLSTTDSKWAFKQRNTRSFEQQNTLAQPCFPNGENSTLTMPRTSSKPTTTKETTTCGVM